MTDHLGQTDRSASEERLLADLAELATAAREYREIKEDVSYRQLAGHSVPNEQRAALHAASERLSDALHLEDTRD